MGIFTGTFVDMYLIFDIQILLAGRCSFFKKQKECTVACIENRRVGNLPYKPGISN